MDGITVVAIVIILAILFYWFLGWVNSLKFEQRKTPTMMASEKWQEYNKEKHY